MKYRIATAMVMASLAWMARPAWAQVDQSTAGLAPSSVGFAQPASASPYGDPAAQAPAVQQAVASPYAGYPAGYGNDPANYAGNPAAYGGYSAYAAGYPGYQYGAADYAAQAQAQAAAYQAQATGYADNYGAAANDALTSAEGCDGACGGACDACCDPCCPPCPAFWEHRTGVFAGFLYLRARNVDVAYAQIRNGIDPNTSVPFGLTATASPDYQPGVQGGFNWALSRTASLRATYTYFQSETNDTIVTAAPLVIHSLVTHPSTVTAAADSLVAQARYDIRFQMADIDYRRLLSGGRNHAVNYSIGTRYAHLDQIFRSAQLINGLTNVATDIGFDGVGTKIGLEGERKMRDRGFMMYGRSSASVLIGTFHSNFTQTNVFAPPFQAVTHWDDSRAIAILDYELGGGWQSECGRVRVTAGYYFASWFNAVTTPQFTQAVRTGNFVNLEDTITFDGLTSRVELRW